MLAACVLLAGCASATDSSPAGEEPGSAISSGSTPDATAALRERCLSAIPADAEPTLEGGPVERWAERPVTRFERKGLDVDRDIADFCYRRTS